jgi:hypothetical protein
MSLSVPDGIIFLELPFGRGYPKMQESPAARDAGLSFLFHEYELFLSALHESADCKLQFRAVVYSLSSSF